MKLLNLVSLSFVLLVLSAQIQSGGTDMVYTGMFIMSLLGGFLLGQLALTSFMVILMAIVPPDEARSLQTVSFASQSAIHHHRVSRSVSPDSFHQLGDSHGPSNPSENNRRNAKFLSNLLRTDSMNCMPQVMCELSSAREPSDSTGTLNDYMYLMNEILTPDDEDDSEKPYKKSSNKFKADAKSLSKKRRPVKKNDSDEDSSGSPEDLSKPSEEIKVQGRAELMELEEEDVLEEKALEDMVKEDPGDIAFALADMRKRDGLKEMVKEGEFKHLESSEDSTEFGYLPGFDETSYNRNTNLLGKSLRESRALRHSSLGNSPAVQEGFIHRKQRELKQTNNLFDRVRVAAEVGDFTRSARKCRALFDTCSTPQVGINHAVNSIRKAIVGTPMNGKNGLNNSELKRLINELKLQQSLVPGGTDVKVVLNFGGSQDVLQAQQTPSAPQQIATVESSKPPPLPTRNFSATVSKKLEALESFLQKQSEAVHNSTIVSPSVSTPAKPQDAMKTVSRNKNGKKPLQQPSVQVVNGKKQKKKPKKPASVTLSANTPKNSTQSPPTVFKLDLIPEIEKTYQKPTQTPKSTPSILEMSKTIAKLSKIIDSKIKKLENSDESLSLESSEESQELTGAPPKKLKTTTTNAKKPAQSKSRGKSPVKPNSSRSIPRKSVKKPAKAYIATPSPRVDEMYPMYYNNHYEFPQSQPTAYPSFNSFVEKAHNFLFSNRQVAPLPMDPIQYVPSAQRHAFQNQYPIEPPYMNERGQRSHRSDQHQPSSFPKPAFQFSFPFWK